jgi:hypothetical protein
MKKAKRRMGTLLFALALLGAGGVPAGLAGPGEARGQGDDKLRADSIAIDELKAFGVLTQPPVVFLHDKHTAALGKQKEFYKKDCGTCHLSSKEGTMYLSFRRDDTPLGAEAIKDTFHKGCISCHMDMAAAGQQSGPKDVECKGCHNSRPDVASNWQPLVVDKRLHYRHAATRDKTEDKCGACHHVYDVAAAKTVPASKPEQVPGACVYCHGETTTTVPGRKPETIRSARLAAHGECVTCHRQTAAAGKDVPTGPATCVGCHGPLDQKTIAETSAKRVPEGADLRIKRGQPDLTLVRPAVAEKPTLGADGKPIKPYGMPPVPFDHKDHEAQSETCVACHHAALTSCAGTCHTVAGTKDGGFVTLETAMHKADAASSCAGCHATAQKKPECAGCHANRKKGVGDTAACAACHATPPADLEKTEADLMARPASPDTAAAEADLAGKLLAAKRTVTATFPVEDIPETVTIASLTKDYEPSVLPHRKIVASMVAGMKDSKLAGAFHQGDAAVCQGCHHMSPASKTPPRCGNCHPAVETTSAAGRPALKAAYHNQCMGCHTAMGIDGKVVDQTPGAKPVPKATDCTGCHQEKKH